MRNGSASDSVVMFLHITGISMQVSKDFIKMSGTVTTGTEILKSQMSVFGVWTLRSRQKESY